MVDRRAHRHNDSLHIKCNRDCHGNICGTAHYPKLSAIRLRLDALLSNEFQFLKVLNYPRLPDCKSFVEKFMALAFGSENQFGLAAFPYISVAHLFHKVRSEKAVAFSKYPQGVQGSGFTKLAKGADEAP
jgi:hypothetical protein